MIWALPNTLLGLLLALASRSKYVKTHYPALVFEPGGWLGRYMKSHYWTGLTLGHVVFLVDPDNSEVACHELIHVFQNQIFGPLWLPLYGLASLVLLQWPGHNYYRDNPFEKWAYSWQDFGCHQRGKK